MTLEFLFKRLKGGPSSGNFGHSGRPGKVGGSTTLSFSGLDPEILKSIVNGNRLTQSPEEALEVLAYFDNQKIVMQKELDKLRSLPSSSETNIAIKELRNKIWDIDEKASNTLNVSDPSNLNPDISRYSIWGPNIERGVKEGISDFNRLVSKKVLPKDPEKLPKVSFGNDVYRAYYDEQKKTAFVPGDTSFGAAPRWDVSHELGHWLESNSKGNTGLARKTYSYWKGRTKNQRYKSMRELTGNKSYDINEKTKPDSFMSPYMGKIYQSGGAGNTRTEIISMGVEYMAKDPITFAKKDPETFSFVYNAVRGKY